MGEDAGVGKLCTAEDTEASQVVKVIQLRRDLLSHLGPDGGAVTSTANAGARIRRAVGCEGEGRSRGESGRRGGQRTEDLAKLTSLVAARQ